MKGTTFKFLLGGTNGSNDKSYTLNFDGSYNHQVKKAGAGCLIRDNEGQLIIAASYDLGAINPESSSVAMSEAVALNNGLKLAMINNIKLDHIKGDSKEIIAYVMGLALREPKAPLSAIIQEIQAHLYKMNIGPLSSKIELVNREANKVADKLARWGRSNNLEMENGALIYNKEDELPDQIARMVKQEKVPSIGSRSNSNSMSMSMSMAVMVGVGVGAAIIALGVSKIFYRKEKLLANQGQRRRFPFFF